MTDATAFVDDIGPDAGRRLVSLARNTVAGCARDERSSNTMLDDEHAVLNAKAGAFVTIERDERLRGCCGRVQAEEPLGHVVRTSAVDAATNDPRCKPVNSDELDQVTISVTVLSKPTSVSVETPERYPEAITVGRDGLIVTSGRYRGLLLPQVAVDRDWNARAFLTAACQKAGIAGDAWRRGDVSVQRFTARSFEERTPRGEIVFRRYDGAGANASPVCCEDETEEQFDREPMTDGGRPESESVRSPSVAGEFYPGDGRALHERIEECFEHDYGPGPLDRNTASNGGDIIALVAPHAGYQFSGPVAAHGYRALAERGDPDTVIVLGPNHNGRGIRAAVAPHQAWETPIGTVPVDDDLATTIVDESSVAEFDAHTHTGEHSIEVQLPFLQHVLERIAVVPICLTRPGFERAEQLGREIATAIEQTGRDAVIVGSTDLTHYESHDSAAAADEPVTEAIRELDVATIDQAVADGHTMCGPWSTIATLTAADELGASAGELLQYATSGQIVGRKSRVVGYCSAVF